MRWFVVFLLIANIVLFFWVQQSSLNPALQAEIPPPDVGNLRLRNEPAYSIKDAPSQPETPESLQAKIIETEADQGSRPPVVVLNDPSDRATQEAPPPPVSKPEAAVAEQAGIEKTDAEKAPDVEPPSVDEPKPEEVVAAKLDPPSDAVVAEPAPLVVAEEPLPVAVPFESCARVGPFVPADADALLAQLPAHIVLLADTSEEVDVPDGFYVLVPALPNRAAGLKKLEELSEAGFSDTWLFRKGIYNNAISLGLFSRRSSADRHATKVADKGFDVEVRDRTSRSERRWLKLKLNGEGYLKESLPLPEGIRVINSSCPPDGG